MISPEMLASFQNAMQNGKISELDTNAKKLAFNEAKLVVIHEDTQSPFIIDFLSGTIGQKSNQESSGQVFRYASLKTESDSYLNIYECAEVCCYKIIILSKIRSFNINYLLF
jgi:hypothetical protein